MVSLFDLRAKKAWAHSMWLKLTVATCSLHPDLISVEETLASSNLSQQSSQASESSNSAADPYKAHGLHAIVRKTHLRYKVAHAF